MPDKNFLNIIRKTSFLLYINFEKIDEVIHAQSATYNKRTTKAQDILYLNNAHKGWLLTVRTFSRLKYDLGALRSHENGDEVHIHRKTWG